MPAQLSVKLDRRFVHVNRGRRHGTIPVVLDAGLVCSRVARLIMERNGTESVGRDSIVGKGISDEPPLTIGSSRHGIVNLALEDGPSQHIGPDFRSQKLTKISAAHFRGGDGLKDPPRRCPQAEPGVGSKEKQSVLDNRPPCNDPKLILPVRVYIRGKEVPRIQHIVSKVIKTTFTI